MSFPDDQFPEPATDGLFDDPDEDADFDLDGYEDEDEDEDDYCDECGCDLDQCGCDDEDGYDPELEDLYDDDLFDDEFFEDDHEGLDDREDLDLEDV